MLKTTRRFFSTLALRYCDLMSAGWVQVALVASSYQAFSGCSASGWRSQKARRVDTAITRIGRSLVPFWDYCNGRLAQQRVPMIQNGHLIEASTLKISAFLKNLICGRGFGSVFHHQYLNPNLSRLGFFLCAPARPRERARNAESVCGLGEIGLAQAAKSGGKEAGELDAALLRRHSFGWEGVDLQHW